MDHTKGAATLAAYDWLLDTAGRITSQTSTADGTSTFGYDNNWQVTSADHASQTDETFSWDANGNPTMTGWVVDDNNRLTSDGTYNYLYDNEGNRTRKTTIATGAYVEYQWDHRNRLTAVTFKTSADVTTKKVQYAYDMFNRLISRRVDSNGDGAFDSGQRFVYDQAPDKGGLSDTVLVFDDSGSLEHRFLPGPAVDQIFADEDALGEVLWGLTDHQNTVRDVVEYDAGTDTTTVVNHLKYNSFGSITSQTNSALQPLLAWTGRFRDDVTGLQWNLNRWYDPALGRWLSEDPIGFAGGDENLARYVGNSPLNVVDPSGLSGFPTADERQQYLDYQAEAERRMREHENDSVEEGGTVSFWDDPLDWAFGSTGVVMDAGEDPLAGWVGTNVIHPGASTAAEIVDWIVPDQFTLSAGISADVHILIIHLSVSADLHFGYSNEDGVTVGVSGGGAVASDWAWAQAVECMQLLRMRRMSVRSSGISTLAA